MKPIIERQKINNPLYHLEQAIAVSYETSANPLQDGFGWTNGVLLKLMDKYGVKEQ